MWATAELSGCTMGGEIRVFLHERCVRFDAGPEFSDPRTIFQVLTTSSLFPVGPARHDETPRRRNGTQVTQPSAATMKTERVQHGAKSLMIPLQRE